MIVTITMNPSIDISYPLGEFKVDTVNRCDIARIPTRQILIKRCRISKHLGHICNISHIPVVQRLVKG